jgi:hypothetical protein
MSLISFINLDVRTTDSVTLAVNCAARAATRQPAKNVELFVPANFVIGADHMVHFLQGIVFKNKLSMISIVVVSSDDGAESLLGSIGRVLIFVSNTLVAVITTVILMVVVWPIIGAILKLKRLTPCRA